MPEGHKTHFLARQHSGWFEDEPLKVTSPQGRFRADARKVSGKTLTRCVAVGKHLFYEFDNDRMIHVHLGRYGKYRLHGNPAPSPVGLVRMRLSGRSKTLDLTGPSTCRVIDHEEQHFILNKLGPDPLAGGKKLHVWDQVRSSGKPIGALLLDQSVVAGVGNIFRAEVLFEIGLDPRTPGDDLQRAVFDQLWRSLLKMMRTGLKYGKIVTVSSQEARQPLAELEGKDRFRIYGKPWCPRCGGPIETLSIASRKLYWCPTCQS
jgi:endonuclease-8